MKISFFIILVFLMNIMFSRSTENAVDNSKTREINDPMVGRPNPSACYCVQMGYPILTEKDSLTDGERGMCILPNGAKVSAWSFYRGEVYPEYSYCTRRGYSTITDTVINPPTNFTTVCAACVEYDSLNNIIMKMPMTKFMLLYDDTLCNGQPFNFNKNLKR